MNRIKKPICFVE